MIGNKDGVKNNPKDWFIFVLNRVKKFIFPILISSLLFVFYLPELFFSFPDNLVLRVILFVFFISVALSVCVNLLLFILNLENKKKKFIRFIRQSISVLWASLFCCYLALIPLSFVFPSDYGSVFGWSLDFGITCFVGFIFYVLGWLSLE